MLADLKELGCDEVACFIDFESDVTRYSPDSTGSPHSGRVCDEHPIDHRPLPRADQRPADHAAEPAGTGRAQRPGPAAVPPRDAAAPVPLSGAQLDLWVYESLYPGTPNLNLCSAYHFDTPVEPAQLEAALTAIQDSHDILRTRISGPTGAPRVSFPDAGPFVLEREDLRGTGRTVAQAFRDFRSRPFDLRGRLIRGRFVQADEQRCTLMLGLHHIITDWWSFDVLQDDFTRAYLALRDGAEPELVRPELQYADFACWQAELEASGVFGARLEFWSRYLADPPAALNLARTRPVPRPESQPELRPQQPEVSPAIVQLPFRVGPQATTAVRALARANGVSVYVVLMSAFAALAHKVSGAQDLVLGTPVANRSAQGWTGSSAM
ncbi:hypothetical protein GXW82_04485 [Streptacidiphilus sp. 4-A2]|nr:hypothetical protein [Streptacidiphilus sp. 4-A2]